MTREKAIEAIKFGHCDDIYFYKEYEEAVNMAIKALEQEPYEDCISKEKAKQFLYERLDRLNDDELYDVFSTIIDDMYNELPSVTPATKWHKVEDELPDIGEEVLVNDGSDMFVAWWVNDGFEARWHSFDESYDLDTPILAWMPLPQPYKEREE